MPTTLIIVAAVAILIILLATASYKVCPADRVMVITGPGGRRFVSGGSAFIIPFIMRVDWLSLGAVQSLLRTDTPIPTKDAILIDVNAVANFQIASETMTVDENGKQLATTKTDEAGKYIFERLDANGNKYRIQFTKVNHRDFTTPDVGDKTPATDGSSTDSDAYTDEDNKLTITLTQDAPTKEHVDAGVLPETWLATMPHTGMGLLLPLLMLVSISGLVTAIILLRKKEEQ